MDSSRDYFQHETGRYFSAGSMLTGWCPSHSSHNQRSTLTHCPLQLCLTGCVIPGSRAGELHSTCTYCSHSLCSF